MSLEKAREYLAAVQLEPEVPARGEAHEPVELRLDASLLGDLDEQRGRKLARVGQQLVVDVDLLLDGLRFREALGPAHLLDLVQDGETTFEDERHAVAEEDAPLRFHGDHVLPPGVANQLVFVEVLDVVELELSHQTTASP